MNKIINHNFVKMVGQGILGALIGIFSGMFLGVIIYLLQFPLIWLSNLGHLDQFKEYSYNYEIWPTAATPGTIGSCFGAIIGSWFGSLLSLKELSKKSTDE